MARISRGEVERVAELARLSLSDEQAERMTSELDRILETAVDVSPSPLARSHPRPTR